MFEDVDLTYVLLPTIAVVLIFSVVTRNRFSVAAGLKLRTVFFGIVLTMLWFSLPSTASLASFGYPDSVESIATPEKTLKYLQRYNDAIVRTTEVLNFMIFLVVFWFLTTFLDVIKFADSKKASETAHA